MGEKNEKMLTAAIDRAVPFQWFCRLLAIYEGMEINSHRNVRMGVRMGTRNRCNGLLKCKTSVWVQNLLIDEKYKINGWGRDVRDDRDIRRGNYPSRTK